VVDFERTTGILSRMEEETWAQARLDPGLYSRIRAQMFAELQNATSFNDFMHVEEFLKKTNVAATDAENEAFSSGFGTYIRSQFSYDLASISGDYLDHMADFLSEMITEYGYKVSDQYERVMQAIAERDDEIKRRADVQPYYLRRDAAASERVDEEAIASMFDSLR
jgi:hypothetical protein